MMKHLTILFVFMASFTCAAFAQKQVRKDIRQGNKEYRKEKYTDAEVDYRRAIEANAHSTEAAYNLGNALYKQQKGKEALEQYLIVTGSEQDKTKLSQTWHNIGNIFLASAKDQEGNYNNEVLKNSIEAYKNALRNNPKDDETRYNLALAQKLLQDNQDENQDKDKDKNKDKDNQDKNKEQEQQQNQDQQQQEQKQDQQQQNPNEMSKENADQILDAMMQEEKNTQEKVKMQQMQQQKQRKTDKNW